MNLNWFSKTSTDGPTLNLAVAGDLCAVRGFETRLLEHPVEEVFDPALLAELRESDVSLVNVECVLSDADATQMPGYGLRTNPRLATVFRSMGMTVAGLANNHIRDLRSQGVMDTIRHLTEAGIDCVGAGKNLHTARQPWIRDVNGIRLGLYLAAERELNVASDTRAGASLFDPRTLPQEVAAIKKQVDVLVVSIHAGHEFTLVPSPRIVKAYRSAIDAGADAVIGHHPHVVQGIELHQGQPIVYSLGNFCFDSDYVCKYPHWETGFLARLKLGRRGVRSLDLVPYTITRGQRVTAMDAAQAESFRGWMKALSAVLESDPAIAQAFQTHARERFDRERMKMFADLPQDLQGDRRATAALRWFNQFQCPAAVEFYQAVFRSYVDECLPDAEW